MTEQENREKVIKGLKCCQECDGYTCRNLCPYHDRNESENQATCTCRLAHDALALLKAQEPRLVTEADFKNADPYGYLPVWVEDKYDNEIICDCITKYAITEPDEDYHYRYWTSRPTDEQRENVKWDAQEQRDYEAAVEMAEYCERYEPTYNADDGSM